ncbi:uncharacterized protein LOC107044482 [Diachasma alloeum]|uniref:uncharacterized protein LOC107044482 n=1 Tax=Diachasma alloeum TaxID=454923 RepID=UPI0007385065|nr:uncharacterized protein LOC107044482 [Diachasma alloeum]
MAKTKSKKEVDKAYYQRQRGNKPPKQARKSANKRMREYRARKKALLTAAQAGVSIPGSAIPAAVAESSETIEPPSTSDEPDLTERILAYSDFAAHDSVRKEFKKQFLDNTFGEACNICDRLWFKNDLKTIEEPHRELLQSDFPQIDINHFKACKTCLSSLNRNKIPTFSTSNGFKYPPKPANLPELDLISERLISPRIPFMQIRRLRHMSGQYGILGQVINVPVDVNLMVNALPRDVSDDYCINVHIKRKQIHKSSYLTSLINKRNIKAWLQYLCNNPLYKFYNITIKEDFFNYMANEQIPIDEISENMTIEDCLTAQQQTLLWNEEKYLQIAPGEKNVPHSLLFDEHAEELSFPAIYLGHFRVFKEEIHVTPFMMATSELNNQKRDDSRKNNVTTLGKV